MTRWRKIIGLALLGIVMLLIIAISATIGWRPFFGPHARALTARRFESTPQRLERGAYVVNNLAGCVGCHSENDWNNHTLPVKGKEGAGRTFELEGLPWLSSPNITPDRDTGAGTWTDDMLARAIREGISYDGRALFPMMPYQAYSKMPDEDLASVIVYIRSLPPVRNAVPRTKMPFPLNRFINLVPEPITAPVAPPDLSTALKRGEHLMRIADCAGCHTPRDERGAAIPGLDMAGGNLFVTPKGTVVSVNITPHPSGIPYYTEEVFVQMMRTGRVIERQLSDAMPWAFYSRMTDDDLKAMFAFMKTLPPARHSTDNSLPPTDCKLCKNKHGAGERNGTN